MTDLVEGLSEASSNWRSLSENGKRLVLSHYDWAVIGKKLVSVYEESLGVNLEGSVREVQDSAPMGGIGID